MMGNILFESKPEFSSARSQLSMSVSTRPPQVLYGRNKQLGQLFTVWDGAAAGEVSLLAVKGFTGHGKTAFLECISRVRQAGLCSS
jgi:Cdc6-like AAA superfamily ATPase